MGTIHYPAYRSLLSDLKHTKSIYDTFDAILDATSSRNGDGDSSALDSLTASAASPRRQRVPVDELRRFLARTVVGQIHGHFEEFLGASVRIPPRDPHVVRKNIPTNVSSYLSVLDSRSPGWLSHEYRELLTYFRTWRNAAIHEGAITSPALYEAGQMLTVRAITLWKQLTGNAMTLTEVGEKIQSTRDHVIGYLGLIERLAPKVGDVIAATVDRPTWIELVADDWAATRDVAGISPEKRPQSLFTYAASRYASLEITMAEAEATLNPPPAPAVPPAKNPAAKKPVAAMPAAAKKPAAGSKPAAST